MLTEDTMSYYQSEVFDSVINRPIKTMSMLQCTVFLFSLISFDDNEQEEDVE